MNTIDTTEIVKLYQSGLSSLQTATRLKTTKRLVLCRLSKAGIKCRPLSQALRKFNIDDDFFECIDSEIKAYWLGFLLADGNISYTGRYNKSNVLRCTLKREDKGHLQKLMAAINTNKPVKDIIAINRKTGKKHLASFARISCTKLCHDLNKLGWQPFKRNGVTTILDNIPDHMKRHTVRGLIDGDGWISQNRIQNRWTIGYCDLFATVVQWVKDWLSIGGTRVFCTKNNKAFRISYHGTNQINHIVRLLYCNCTIALDRKLMLANAAVALPHNSKIGNRDIAIDKVF